MYVFGGYTGPKKRSCTIEKLEKNTWKVMDFKMNKGVESGLIVPGPRAHEFMILGGNLHSGACSHSHVYNLEHNTGKL